MRMHAYIHAWGEMFIDLTHTHLLYTYAHARAFTRLRTYGKMHASVPAPPTLTLRCSGVKTNLPSSRALSLPSSALTKNLRKFSLLTVFITRSLDIRNRIKHIYQKPDVVGAFPLTLTLLLFLNTRIRIRIRQCIQKGDERHSTPNVPRH